jgi:hypothetical protein
MASLLVITGPIASGKSSIAQSLGHRLRQTRRSVVVLDFDDLVDTVGGFQGITSERFNQTLTVYGQLIGAWLSVGLDVIAHVPAFSKVELDAVLHAVPTGTNVRRALLFTTYEVALERVAADPARTLSRDPELLRRAFERFEALVPHGIQPDWTFDTTSCSIASVVEQLSSALVREGLLS